MRSRGSTYSLGAGARKSLVLFWTALFMCSVLLQYVSLAAPSTALAVHDEGLFELEGNALDQGTPGDDWENGTPTAEDSLFIPGSVEKDGPDATYFTGGGSKDENNIGAWDWTTTDVAPDKDELLDVFAAVYKQAGDTFVYFGADKFDDSGDAQIGYWFFRNNVSLGADGFNGTHATGDVLVLSDFTNGGGVDRICVYEWNPPGGTSLIANNAGCDTGDNLVLVAAGADCEVGDGTYDVCAVVNSATETAPWPFLNKSGATDFGPGQFYEGGINLTDLFEGSPPCFNSFLAETRSSQETDAQLKDFALGSLDTCAPPDLATEASTHNADFGASVTDTATLSGTSGPASGTVEFFLCGPSGSYPDCDNGGTKVGATKTVDASANGGTATSDPYLIGTTAAAAGKYCFRAEYTPDGASQYLATEHTNKTTECFKVDPATIEIVKTANPAGPVNAGEEIGFDITVTNGGTTTTLGVTVSDPLPAGVDWTMSAPTGSTTGLDCSITGAVGSETLNCTKPSLAAGASFTVHVSGMTDAADCDAVSNTANVTTGNDGSDSDGASVTVNCPDIRILKTPDGSDVNAGDTATFSITVENLGPGTATSVSLEDELPSGVAWTLGSVTGDTAGVSCAVTGAAGDQTLTCTDASMASGQRFTVQVSGATDKADCPSIPNLATVSAGNEPSGNSGNNADNGSIDVLCAQIEIVKTADDDTVNAGDEIGFMITISNTGDGTAYGVSASDTLNPAFSWSIGAPSAGWTLVGNELSYAAASLAGGASSSVHVVATSAPEACGVVNNTATVSTDNDGDDSDSASITIQCPDVTVEKTADASPINAGDTASFTITVGNAGPGTAYDVTLSDSLPAGVAWTDDSDACEINAGILTCDFGDLAAGATASVTISGLTTAAVCGLLDNTAFVEASNEAEENTGNNSDGAQIVVNCPDVHVDKSADSSPISAGNLASFTITVTNDGLGTAYDVTLTDTLPAGVAWSDDSAACSIAAGVLSCDFGDLAPGASASVTVFGTTTAAVCGDLDNTALVAASNESAEDALDNSDDATIVVNCPDLHVDKSADNSPISAGDTASFTITVTNDGPGTAYNVTLADTLPAGIAWSDDSASCAVNAGVLTCNFGTLPSGASASVTVSGETDADDCHVLPNTATASASNESDEDAQDNSDSAEIAVNCADIVITKTADDDSVSAGDQIGFTITVTNNGPGEAKGVTVTDTLPTDPGLSWSIAPADAAWTISGGVLSFGPADLASGASVSVHIVSPTTPASCGTVDNLAAVDTSNDGDDEDSSSIDVLCPDVRISKAADNSPILSGDTASFTITVWNDGPGTAYDVEVEDALPAGIAWTENSAVCSIAAGVLSCDFGDLADGEQASVTVSGVTDAEDCGRLPNLATVSASNEPEPAPGANSDDAVIDVQCAAIEIVKRAGDAADGDEYVTEPGDVLFTYEVTNTGTADLENVVVVDDNATPADPSDDVVITCPQATLDAGESMTCTATLPVGFGLQTNVAEVTANPVLDAEAEVSDEDDAVVRVPDLMIDKSFTGNSAPDGPSGEAQAYEDDALTYTLAYTLADGPVTDGIIADVVPAGLEYIAGTATGNDEFTFVDYDAATRTLTWTADDVTKDGTVTYQVKVADGAAELPQPAVNVATIDSDETAPDDDTADVYVIEPPLEITATPRITPPPTNTIDEPAQPSNGLLYLLIAIAGFMLVAGALVPAPARARRRNRRG